MRHRDLTLNHVIENWTFPDQAAREALVGALPEDIGKIAFQEDDNSYWRLLNDDPLTWVAVGASGPSGTQYIHIRDKKGSTVQGGDFLSGAWRTRTLNEIVHDDTGLVSLNSNVISLPAGTYRCHIIAPAFKCNGHQARLLRVSGSVVLLLGTVEWSPPHVVEDGNFPAQTSSTILGRFVLALDADVRIEHQCHVDCLEQGFGLAMGFTNEIYTVAIFEKE